MPHCSTFVILESADPAAERRSGVCLSCGYPWTQHGRPKTYITAASAEEADLLAYAKERGVL